MHKTIIKSALAAVVLGAVTAASAQTLEHRYSFSTGTVDDTVGTADGSLNLFTTISGGALVTANITGSGATLPAAASAGITGAFTISDFYNVQADAVWFSTVFSFSDATVNNYLLAQVVRGVAPFPSSVAVIGAGGSSALGVLTGASGDLGPQHLLVTYDGNTLSYYRNGSLANSLVDPGFNLSSLTDIGISSGSPYGDPSMSSKNGTDGYNYDLSIINGAVTPEQVDGLYALGPDASNAAIQNVLTPTPEPTTLALSGMGLLALAAHRFRNRK